jgi:hypothetical protein
LKHVWETPVRRLNSLSPMETAEIFLLTTGVGTPGWPVDKTAVAVGSRNPPK